MAYAGSATIQQGWVQMQRPIQAPAPQRSTAHGAKSVQSATTRIHSNKTGYTKPKVINTQAHQQA